MSEAELKELTTEQLENEAIALAKILGKDKEAWEDWQAVRAELQTR